MLTTPQARDWKGSGPVGSKSHDWLVAHGDLEAEVTLLLKTPTTQLAVNGGSQHPDKRKAGGHGPTLADEVEHLLPTVTGPAPHDSVNSAGKIRTMRKSYGVDLTTLFNASTGDVMNQP
jgi:hypothetical protein